MVDFIEKRILLISRRPYGTGVIFGRRPRTALRLSWAILQSPNGRTITPGFIYRGSAKPVDDSTPSTKTYRWGLWGYRRHGFSQDLKSCDDKKPDGTCNRPDGRWLAFVVSHSSSKRTLDEWGTVHLRERGTVHLREWGTVYLREWGTGHLRGYPPIHGGTLGPGPPCCSVVRVASDSSGARQRGRLRGPRRHDIREAHAHDQLHGRRFPRDLVHRAPRFPGSD